MILYFFPWIAITLLSEVNTEQIISSNRRAFYEHFQDFDDIDPSFRIIGGVEVVPNSLPYAVFFITYEEKQTGLCSGSLISELFVLTAAHCFENVLELEIFFGMHGLKDEPVEKITVNGINLYSHEKFRTDSAGDIGLIHLPYAVQLNDKVQIINLPRKSQQNDRFVGSTVLASGWGRSLVKRKSRKLRSAEFSVISNLCCAHAYRFFVPIVDSMLCTSTEEHHKSTCYGDSGGPLAFIESDESKTLIGLTSFGGDKCGDSPPVFTRVTSYLDWISEKTGIQIRD